MQCPVKLIDLLVKEKMEEMVIRHLTEPRCYSTFFLSRSSGTYNLDKEIQNKGISDIQHRTLYGRVGKFGPPRWVEGVRPILRLSVHTIGQHRSAHNTNTTLLRIKMPWETKKQKGPMNGLSHCSL